MFNLGQNKPTGLFGGLGNNNATNTTGSPAPGASLFGTPQPQQQQQQQQASAPSGSLFGTPQPAQSTPSGGLFGNTAQNNSNGANNTSGGLFGGLGGTAQSAPTAGQTPSLFGSGTNTNANANATTAPSLFGAKPAAPTTTGSSLFGGATQNSQTNTTAGGLGGSLFGASATNATNTANKPSGTSLFGSTAVSTGAQPAQPPQTNGQHQNAVDPSDSKSQPAYFDQLLERGKKRQHTDATDTSFEQLPSLQLGLGDIARKVRTLGQTGKPAAGQAPSRNARTDSHAHYLLAASGVNTANALRDLSAFDTSGTTASKPTQSPFPAEADIDFDGYVEGLYRQSSLDLVEQGLAQAKKDFDSFLEEHVQMEWDVQRARIYEHFGLVKPSPATIAAREAPGSDSDRGAFGRSSRRGKLGASMLGSATMQKSVLGTASTNGLSKSTLFSDVAEKEVNLGMPTPVPQDRILRDKQDRYSAAVKNLNISRLEDVPYHLFQKFAEIEAQPSAEDTSHFVNAYKALAEIVGEDPSITSYADTGAIRQRQYAADYADDSPSSRKAFSLRKRILDGSRTFLERQFFDQLQAAVAKNPREANLGGVPTAINKVRAYIRLRALRKELGTDSVELQTLNDDYCWVLIFHLLRAGLVQDAAQYVSENERAIKSMDRNFPVYLAAYARSTDRRLSPDLQSRINMEYSQRTRIAPDNSLDPYRMACYKVIGRCELSRRNLEGVANQGIEDWTWLQFALAREVNRVEETASEVFGLDDVRLVIQEIGQRHFTQSTADSTAGQGTYFLLQILAGQFESAIAWLYPHNYLTTVHFAIALDYYGLLRVNDFNGSDDLLSYTTRRQPQISFGHMLGYYTRDFRTSDPTAATDYLVLICLDGDSAGEAGSRQVRLCHDALRELVLETREFAELLGDIRNDGQRIKGAIEQRLKLIRIDNETDFLRQITIVAAQTADDNSRVTDAVLLYHLAEEYDEVMSVCCRAVSDVTCSELGESTLKLEPLRPRNTAATDQQTQQQGQDRASDGSSLSLTSVDDAATLARNMLTLYKSNTLMYAKIKPSNRGLIEILLGMSTAKSQIETEKWSAALDTINSLNLLPLDAEGRINTIRAKAQTFNSLPTLVSRNVGNLLIWTIVAAGRQREMMRESDFEPERKRLADHCTGIAQDIMVFAGLIRYKLSPRVWEVLGRVGGDLAVC